MEGMNNAAMSRKTSDKSAFHVLKLIILVPDKCKDLI